MHTQPIRYAHGATELEGYLAAPSSSGPGRPCVLVAHAWGGQDDFARRKAEALASLGYVGFALDMYGAGRRGSSPEENAELMRPFIEDRALLRDRIQAGAHAASRHDLVDSTRLGAIGFCFGGLCVLDLARSGLSHVKGVVSFHGLLGAPGLGPQGPIHAKVLVLHGYDDPMAPPEAVEALATELTKAGADWQIVMYGRTLHAFTNPDANNPGGGLKYSPANDRRSWVAMREFLGEALA